MGTLHRWLWAVCVCVAVGVIAEAPVRAQVCGNGQVEGDEECDDHNTVGGDGCAANCTREDRHTCAFVPGSSLAFHLFPAGTTPAAALFGTQTITAGHVRASDPLGAIPVVIRAADLQIPPRRLPFAGCACVRAIPADEFGAGNVAQGSVGCGTDGLPQVDYTSVVDHNTHLNDPDPDPTCANGMPDVAVAHSGACNGKPQLTFTSEGPSGSAVITYNLALYYICGNTMCASVPPGAPTQPEGADGIPCTADDPQPAPARVVATTGIAMAQVLHVNDTSQSFGGGVRIDHPLDCGSLATSTGWEELVVGGTATYLDRLDVPPECGVGRPPDGDTIVTLQLNCGAPAATVTPSATPSLGQPTFTRPPLTATATLTQPPTPSRTPTTVVATTTTPLAPTETPAVTATNKPPPSATPTLGACLGDCSGDGKVAVNELVKGVNIALAKAPLSDCPSFDANGVGGVTVDELVRAVKNALSGCS